MDLYTLLALRDKLQIGDISHALDKVNFHGPLVLNAQWSIKFDSTMGGFVAFCLESPDMWFPVCPCKGCQEWSGGGHYCLHMILYLKQKAEQKRNHEAGRIGDASHVAPDDLDEPCEELSLENLKDKVNTEGVSHEVPSVKFSPVATDFRGDSHQSDGFDDKAEDFKPSRRNKGSSISSSHESVECTFDETFFEEKSADENADPNSIPSLDELVTKRGIESLLFDICNARNVDFNALDLEDTQAELLKSIKKQIYKCKKRQVTVSYFGRGYSLQVKLRNGSSFFTCGESGCFCQAENPNGTTFYCNSHKKLGSRKIRENLNGRATLNAYKHAMQTLSKDSKAKVDSKNLDTPIGREGWIRAMAAIYKKVDSEHTFRDAKIFLTVTRFGSILYKNKNKDRIIRKCSWPDCFSSLEKDSAVNIAGSSKFLCNFHKKDAPEFKLMIEEFTKLIEPRSSSRTPVASKKAIPS